jgi:SAM-dependent methyltransferase
MFPPCSAVEIWLGAELAADDQRPPVQAPQRHGIEVSAQKMMVFLSMNHRTDDKYYQAAGKETIANSLMVRARNGIFKDFLALCRPLPTDRILDVGISDVVIEGANLIESLYPYPENITAVGLGVADDFRAAFPKVVYHQIQPSARLPFSDGQFDIVVSNAVLEHVGSRGRQMQFVSELLRVGRTAFITVPNRFFPVEHHTAIPFLHWFDTSFRLACRLANKNEWSRENNLILMSRARLVACCPRAAFSGCGTTGLRLGPFSSNLYLLATGVRQEPT